jgi:redox-sensitive bicupin YhaK (pirin superfamily)
VKVFASILAADGKTEHRLEPGRSAWIQIARGSLKLNDVVLKKGDGAAVTDETSLVFQGIEEVEFLLFDLA